MTITTNSGAAGPMAPVPVRMSDEDWNTAHQLLFTYPPQDTVDVQRMYAAQRVFMEAARLRSVEARPGYHEEVITKALAGMAAERDGAYRERARLVAALCTMFGDQAALSETSDASGYGLAVIQSEVSGQMSWHIAERDFDVFPAIVRRFPEPPQWDGHTASQKYDRLWALAMFEAGWRWFHAERNPEAHLEYEIPADAERPF